jgi:hypothetical protein
LRSLSNREETGSSSKKHKETEEEVTVTGMAEAMAAINKFQYLYKKKAP